MAPALNLYLFTEGNSEVVLSLRLAVPVVVVALFDAPVVFPVLSYLNSWPELSSSSGDSKTNALLFISNVERVDEIYTGRYFRRRKLLYHGLLFGITGGC